LSTKWLTIYLRCFFKGLHYFCRKEGMARKPRSRKKTNAIAPEKAEMALILIDVMNEFDFPGARALLKNALAISSRLVRLKEAFKRHGLPVIYANDNFGRWQSDRNQVLKRCMEPGKPGRDLVRLLKPDDEDYFVLKPKHSAFFATTLETLLTYLGVRKLVLAGFAGNICVLHTAIDAHIRDYEIVVPRDGIASASTTAQKFALHHLRQVIHAEVPTCAQMIARLTHASQRS
jgi:nicotinamidase-related amidase